MDYRQLFLSKYFKAADVAAAEAVEFLGDWGAPLPAAGTGRHPCFRLARAEEEYVSLSERGPWQRGSRA